MLNPDARRARARLAAHRRWNPRATTLDQLTEQCMREIEQSHLSDAIDDLIALAPKMTAEQITRLRRLTAPAR